MSLDPKKGLFLQLAKDLEARQKELNELRERLIASMSELGIGTYVQDLNNYAVYKIVKPTGTFMYYKDIDYVRTALECERAGSLSKKEAEEAGFSVPKK